MMQEEHLHDARLDFKRQRYCMSEDVDNLSSAWMDVFEGSVPWTQNASREMVLP